MNDEPENESGGVGDAPPEAPADSLPELTEDAGREPAVHRKPFSSWGAARPEETGPSLLHRASQRLKSIFARKERPADAEPGDEFATADSDSEGSFSDQELASAPELAAAPLDADAPAAAEPKEDLKFLWTAGAPESHAEEPEPAQAVAQEPAETEAHEPAETEAHEPALDPVSEPEVIEAHSILDNEEELGDEASSPPPKKPGLFARLFTPRSKPVVVEEHDQAVDLPLEPEFAPPAVVPDVTMPMDSSAVGVTMPMDSSALDAAMPMDGSVVDEAPPMEPEAVKSGFFGRLFSRRSEPKVVEEHDLTQDIASAEPVASDELHGGDFPAEAASIEDEFAPPAASMSDATMPMDTSALGATMPMDTSALGATMPMDTSALDEALPMDAADAAPMEPVAGAVEPDFGATLGIPAAEIPAPPAKKPGFFARLMGRISTEEPVGPDLAAALDATPDSAATAEVDHLDAAHDVFAAAKDEFVPEHSEPNAFASVDDALPVDDAPPAHDLPFAATLDASEIADTSYHSMPVYDFDAPKADDRATKEVDLSATLDEGGATAEVFAPNVTLSEVAAHAAEEDRDTDEFEQIDLEATIAEQVDPDKTAEVKGQGGFFRKLFSKTKEVTQIEPAVAAPPTANPHFLVQKFRTFYNEVVVYKNQKAEFAGGFATAILTDYTADLSPDQAAQSLIVRLQQMLELQLAESSWMGGECSELYPDAQYAMAVLADEMLTHVDWPGKNSWGAHRLELAVFKTVAADIEFFKRVDRLLKNGPQTVGTRDLARVYLLVLASGFRGKYRPFDLHRPLAEYRRRLYEFVYGGDALLLYGDDRRIFPEATSVTVAGKGVKRFSMAQQWAAILILMLVGYTVISHLAWNRVSADLKDIAARVEQARTATTTVDSPNGGGGR